VSPYRKLTECIDVRSQQANNVSHSETRVFYAISATAVQQRSGFEGCTRIQTNAGLDITHMPRNSSSRGAITVSTMESSTRVVTYALHPEIPCR
jgi:hypothetical protein